MFSRGGVSGCFSLPWGRGCDDSLRHIRRLTFIIQNLLTKVSVHRIIAWKGWSATAIEGKVAGSKSTVSQIAAYYLGSFPKFHLFG